MALPQIEIEESAIDAWISDIRSHGFDVSIGADESMSNRRVERLGMVRSNGHTVKLLYARNDDTGCSGIIFFPESSDESRLVKEVIRVSAR